MSGRMSGSSKVSGGVEGSSSCRPTISTGAAAVSLVGISASSCVLLRLPLALALPFFVIAYFE